MCELGQRKRVLLLHSGGGRRVRHTDFGGVVSKGGWNIAAGVGAGNLIPRETYSLT